MQDLGKREAQAQRIRQGAQTRLEFLPVSGPELLGIGRGDHLQEFGFGDEGAPAGFGLGGLAVGMPLCCLLKLGVPDGEQGKIETVAVGKPQLLGDGVPLAVTAARRAVLHDEEARGLEGGDLRLDGAGRAVEVFGQGEIRGPDDGAAVRLPVLGARIGEELVDQLYGFAGEAEGGCCRLEAIEQGMVRYNPVRQALERRVAAGAPADRFEVELAASMGAAGQRRNSFQRIVLIQHVSLHR